MQHLTRTCEAKSLCGHIRAVERRALDCADGRAESTYVACFADSANDDLTVGQRTPFRHEPCRPLAASPGSARIRRMRNIGWCPGSCPDPSTEIALSCPDPSTEIALPAPAGGEGGEGGGGGGEGAVGPAGADYHRPSVGAGTTTTTAPSRGPTCVTHAENTWVVGDSGSGGDSGSDCNSGAGDSSSGRTTNDSYDNESVETVNDNKEVAPPPPHPSPSSPTLRMSPPPTLTPMVPTTAPATRQTWLGSTSWRPQWPISNGPSRDSYKNSANRENC